MAPRCSLPIRTRSLSPARAISHYLHGGSVRTATPGRAACPGGQIPACPARRYLEHSAEENDAADRRKISTSDLRLARFERQKIGTPITLSRLPDTREPTASRATDREAEVSPPECSLRTMPPPIAHRPLLALPPRYSLLFARRSARSMVASIDSQDMGSTNIGTEP